MTCIKTGANVWFSAYGFIARCDVYEMGNCFIFRWNTEGIEYCTEQSVPTGTWCVFAPFEFDSWHRQDLGVTVVPNFNVIQGERC